MKAYIFDMDGTLLDSTGLWGKIDVLFLSKRGIDVPPDYARAIAALSFNEAAEYTIERFSLQERVPDILDEWRSMAEYAYANTISMKPHAREYLAELKKRGAKLAVATSMTTTLCSLSLARHGITDWFDAICTADEVPHGKSHPDIFYLAAQKLDVPPSQCVVFEDVPQAIISAKSAKMMVYGVYDKASEEYWDEIVRISDETIRSFREAPLP